MAEFTCDHCYSLHDFKKGGKLLEMLLKLVILFCGVVGAIGIDCEGACNSTETCCPGPNLYERNCCPFENAICCEDGVHCCPEGSFCDLEIRMCGMFVNPEVMRKRSGDLHHSIDSPDRKVIVEENEISNINRMLVHCDLNQYCPYFSTCCHSNEYDMYFCCSNPNGVCCSDGVHCCKQGEQCDSQGEFCLSEVGLETEVRKAESLTIHYEKTMLDFVESVLIKPSDRFGKL